MLIKNPDYFYKQRRAEGTFLTFKCGGCFNLFNLIHLSITVQHNEITAFRG